MEGKLFQYTENEMVSFAVGLKFYNVEGATINCYVNNVMANEFLMEDIMVCHLFICFEYLFY